MTYSTPHRRMPVQTSAERIEQCKKELENKNQNPDESSGGIISNMMKKGKNGMFDMAFDKVDQIISTRTQKIIASCMIGTAFVLGLAGIALCVYAMPAAGIACIGLATTLLSFGMVLAFRHTSSYIARKEEKEQLKKNDEMRNIKAKIHDQSDIILKNASTFESSTQNLINLLRKDLTKGTPGATDALSAALFVSSTLQLVIDDIITHVENLTEGDLQRLTVAITRANNKRKIIEEMMKHLRSISSAANSSENTLNYLKNIEKVRKQADTATHLYHQEVKERFGNPDHAKQISKQS